MPGNVSKKGFSIKYKVNYRSPIGRFKKYDVKI